MTNPNTPKEPKLPEKIYLAPNGKVRCVNGGRIFNAWDREITEAHTPYIPASQAEEEKRRAVAEVWEAAASLARFYCPGDKIFTVFDSKAEAARKEKP